MIAATNDKKAHLFCFQYGEHTLLQIPESKTGGQSLNLNPYAFNLDPLSISIFQQFFLLHIPALTAAPLPLFPADPSLDLPSARAVDSPPRHRRSAFAAEDFSI